MYFVRANIKASSMNKMTYEILFSSKHKNDGKLFSASVDFTIRHTTLLIHFIPNRSIFKYAYSH